MADAINAMLLDAAVARNDYEDCRRRQAPTRWKVKMLLKSVYGGTLRFIKYWEQMNAEFRLYELVFSTDGEFPGDGVIVFANDIFVGFHAIGPDTVHLLNELSPDRDVCSFEIRITSILELESVISHMERELQVTVIFPSKPKAIMLEYRRLCAELMDIDVMSPDYLMSEEFSSEIFEELSSGGEISEIIWAEGEL